MSTERLSVAWIAVGSNLDRPAEQVANALEALAALDAARLLTRSRYYRTAPVGGPPGQSDFCNAAAALATSLSPINLLDALNAIEVCHGRIRSQRNAPRTLDLDIVAFDDRVQVGPRLTLPHPRAAERAFVVIPLADIAPTLALGSRGRVVDCLQCVDAADVTPWDQALPC